MLLGLGVVEGSKGDFLFMVLASKNFIKESDLFAWFILDDEANWRLSKADVHGERVEDKASQDQSGNFQHFTCINMNSIILS